MKSKQRNERARVKALLRNSGSKHVVARGKEEGRLLEMIEGMVRHSIQDAYRVIAVTDRHINESASLMTRHRRNAGRRRAGC